MSAVLFSAHAMLSGITRTDELRLEETEAEELAKALNTVNQFYKVEVAEKTIAWINLTMVAGMIYGTRFIAIRERVGGERRARRTTQERPASGLSGEQPMPSPVAEAPGPLTTELDAAEAPDDFIPGFHGFAPRMN